MEKKARAGGGIDEEWRGRIRSIRHISFSSLLAGLVSFSPFLLIFMTTAACTTQKKNWNYIATEFVSRVHSCRGVIVTCSLHWSSCRSCCRVCHSSGCYGCHGSCWFVGGIFHPHTHTHLFSSFFNSNYGPLDAWMKCTINRQLQEQTPQTHIPKIVCEGSSRFKQRAPCHQPLSWRGKLNPFQTETTFSECCPLPNIECHWQRSSRFWDNYQEEHAYELLQTKLGVAPRFRSCHTMF